MIIINLLQPPGSYAGSAGHYVLLLSFRSSFFSFFRRLSPRSLLARSIVNKLCNVLDGDRDLQESCAIAKMTAQCALHMGALNVFGTP